MYLLYSICCGSSLQTLTVTSEQVLIRDRFSENSDSHQGQFWVCCLLIMQSLTSSQVWYGNHYVHFPTGWCAGVSRPETFTSLLLQPVFTISCTSSNIKQEACASLRTQHIKSTVTRLSDVTCWRKRYCSDRGRRGRGRHISLHHWCKVDPVCLTVHEKCALQGFYHS